METLRRLARYNAWANARVFAACVGLDDGALGAEAKGTVGTLEQTLKHTVLVEDAYLTMLGGGDPRFHDAYLAHDLRWFAARAAELADGYDRLLAEADEAFLHGPLKVPWFDFALTRRDGLLQVFTHSTQHRAQVLSTLGDRGVAVPDVDYVGVVARRGP